MRRAYRIALVSFVVALPLLMAPTGGLPSRPRFQSVGVNVAAPATGNLTASGTVTGATVTSSGALNGASLVVSGSTATVAGVQVATNGVEPAGGTAVGRIVSQQYKGGNTDRSNTATLAADPTLTGLAVPAAGSYIVEGHLCFVGPVSGAGGIKMRYEFSGSVSSGLGMYSGFVNAAVVAAGNFLAFDANQVTFTTITTGSGGDCVRFTHTASFTGSGTVDLQWAQATSNANATRLLAGSAVWIIRLS